MVAPPQLERVEVELRGQLVEQALEPERALDEARRAERGHRRRSSASRRGASSRRSRRRRASASARPCPTPSRPSRPRSRTRRRARRACRRSARRPAAAGSWRCGCPAARFSSRRVSAQRTGRPVRRASSAAIERVVAGAVLRAEAAAHELAHDPDAIGRQLERAPPPRRGCPRCTGSRCRRRACRPATRRPPGGSRSSCGGRLRAVLGLDDDVRRRRSPPRRRRARSGSCSLEQLRPRATASSGSSSGSSSSHSTAIASTAARACASRVGCDGGDGRARVAAARRSARRRRRNEIASCTPGSASAGAEVERAHATPRRAGCAGRAAWSIPGSATSAV